MQIKLSSQKREIIDYGTVFLFEENADFTLSIKARDSSELRLLIDFAEDITGKQQIKADFSENRIQFTCINFAAEGTGLTEPLEIAVIDGKKIYFMFWAYLEGNNDQKSRARKIEYTLYSE